MTRPQFGICAMCRNVPQYLEWARTAEAAGFDLLGYGDTQNLIPDAYVMLAAFAQATTRIRLCTTVSNPVTRHPTLAASGFAALQQLSGGRTIFGIGTGDSALHNIGARVARVDELAAYCGAVRRLARGEEIEYGGVSTRLHWDVVDVPIYLAAEGPRMMQLAGEIGDGVIFANGFSPDVVRDNLARVRAAATGVGRDPSAIEPWFFVKVVLTDEPEHQVWNKLAWTLAASANHAFRYTFDGKFVPESYEAPLRRLMDGYRSSEHNRSGVGAHNAALVNDAGLAPFLGERFLLAGPSTHIVERLHGLIDAGVRNIIFTAIFGDPVGETQRLADEVLARF